MTSLMMSFSLNASKHIFKYSLEMSWLLSLKFGMNGGIEVVNSCMILKLKTKHLKTIYDDVIIPFRHASNRQRPIFSEFYGLSKWNLAFRDIFCCLLVTLHQKGKKRIMDQVMMMSSI